VALVYLKAAICSPLLALFQISWALFWYSKAALVSAAFTIVFVLFLNLAIELAINFYWLHCKATSDTRFAKFSKEKVDSLACSEVPPVNFSPSPANVFNVLDNLGSSSSFHNYIILFNIGNDLANSLAM
jgi:hypothetical protein